MATVLLDVRSVNNVNVTAFDQNFETERMSGVRANQNLNNAIAIAEAGDTQTILSAWTLNADIGSGIKEGSVYYWTFQSAGDVRTIRLYGNATRTYLLSEGSVTIADGDNATCFLTGVNDSNLTGSVLITIAGGGALDDTDAGNTLTVTGVTTSNDLQLNGLTEFSYIENREVKTKYTVQDTVAEIYAMANPQ